MAVTEQEREAEDIAAQLMEITFNIRTLQNEIKSSFDETVQDILTAMQQVLVMMNERQKRLLSQ